MCLAHSLQTSRGIWFIAWKQRACAVHVQHMWGKKTDWGKGRWIGALAPGSAMQPQLQMYSVFGSTDPTHAKHTDNGPKTWGWPAHSIHKRYPPATWPLHVSRWLNYSRRDSENHQTLKEFADVQHRTMTCLDKSFPISANMTCCLRIGLIGGLPL